MEFMRNLVSILTVLLMVAIRAKALPYIVNTNGVGTNTTLQGTTTADKVVATNFTGNGGSLSNVVPIGEYATNETSVAIAVNTNGYFMSGAGDAGVNGSYLLKGTFGGITVWTNANGLAGLFKDLGNVVFPHAVGVTNSAGSLRYDNDNANPLTSDISSDWQVVNGVGPVPVVVLSTNTFNSTYTAYYYISGITPPGFSEGTNVYYVNSRTGNDTNAIAGRSDRPWKNLTNVMWYLAVHTNDIIKIFPGTNYFGYTDIQISNGVSIMGLGPNAKSCWIDKDAGLVDVSDISIKAGVGSTFANFSGNVSIGISKANVSLYNLYFVGVVDCFLVSGGSSNLVMDGCTFEVNAPDNFYTIIDAGVINSGYNNIKNTTFISRRRGNSAAGAGNATTRRGLVIKGGTNTVTGCLGIATDSTNSCQAFVNEGGYNIYAGCNGQVWNTNGFAVAVTNADLTVIPAGPFSMVYSNGVAKWISPLSNPSLLIRSNTLASIPTLSKGDVYLWSSNSILYSINCSAAGVLTTNKLAP